MDTTRLDTPVFRSRTPEELARATGMLETASVPFRVESQAGMLDQMSRTMRRSYTILVAAEHEKLARDTVASVPSEVILPKFHLPPSRLDKFMPWVLVIMVALIILISFVWYAIGYWR